jgi:regulator of RNase E activity RraB
MPKRAKAGDVLRLSTPKGFAYLQYIGRHPVYGDAVLVSPKLSEHVDDQTFLNGYVTFYPLQVAVARRFVEVVDHWEPPELPQCVRRAGATRGTEVITWTIKDGINETIKQTLSEQELKLPIAEIWNHEFLVHRILEGWNPGFEGAAVSSGQAPTVPHAGRQLEAIGAGDDKQAVNELASVSDTDAPHVILHYVYLPNKEAAASVAQELRSSGYETEERLGADGADWLVLARHVAVPTGELMVSTRQTMETLVSRFGGEYDGWEADVRIHGDGPPSFQ